MSSGYTLFSPRYGLWMVRRIDTDEFVGGEFKTMDAAAKYIEEHPLDRSRDKQRAEKTSA